MNKILDAQDILSEVRDFIEMYLDGRAASHVERGVGDPIAAVANAASEKIDGAIKLLAKCHGTDAAASPIPAGAQRQA